MNAPCIAMKSQSKQEDSLVLSLPVPTVPLSPRRVREAETEDVPEQMLTMCQPADALKRRRERANRTKSSSPLWQIQMPVLTANEWAHARKCTFSSSRGWLNLRKTACIWMLGFHDWDFLPLSLWSGMLLLLGHFLSKRVYVMHRVSILDGEYLPLNWIWNVPYTCLGNR